MKSYSHDRDPPEKERIRAEIERQVEEFLRRGGQISVFDNTSRESRVTIGSVWHGHDDFQGMTD